jgi:CheY-like chemotaxis protein
MDIRMPGVNGLEAMRVIHAVLPTLPIVLMTAYAGDLVTREAEREAAAVLVKPFDLPLMLELVGMLSEL